jgi:uncharacterized protein YbaP (TraB family)
MLTIPCLYLAADAGPTSISNDNLAYSLGLLYDGEFFQQSSLLEIQRRKNCSASFNTSTNALSDRVRVGDDLYELVLTLNLKGTFSIASAGFLKRADSSLWRVSDGINEVLIGGTIHVLKESDKPLPAVFEEAFATAKILVTEISYDDLKNTAANASLPIRTDGKTLSNTLPPSTYQLLSAHLQSIGTSIRLLEIVEPAWLAQLLISTEISRLGYSSGVDLHFMELAQALGKTNAALETVESQVSALTEAGTGLTDDEVILQALSDVSSSEFVTGIELLVRAWREGDVEFIRQKVIEPTKVSNMDGYKIIFTDRNAAWVPQIEAFLSTPELELLLVGVGHLVGSDSVLKMLEDLGYSVNRY